RSPVSTVNSEPMLDFHNHLMPGVDDGAANLDESRAGLAAFRNARISEVITTPHIRASMMDRPEEFDPYMAALDTAWGALTQLATEEFPEMALDRGTEVMLDIPSPNLSDPRVRLAGTSFVLIEFPFMNIPPHSVPAIRNIVESGWIPVIAHPERYRNMPGNHDLVEHWREAGARMQVNTGSLVGQYGSTARTISWELLRRGCVDYLSSDYHARGKCTVGDAVALLEKREAVQQLHALLTGNAERLLRNEMPLPVEPLEEESTSVWKRLLPWSSD
ncbi:MAG TPA: CpsB/CapC family capsule biosynthesis tyrosine phosphatase, partial [Gemmatimonadaceae bacterium]|nr:CpsB/CapC family capsule biosynthesis tyrosine phosphatase [Gemmatimonadaceae bacterium]